MKKRCNIIDSALNTSYYFQMPKFLFSAEYKALKSDSRVIYSLLKDRHQISTYKKMANKNGEIFIIYPREKMAELLDISVPTVRKAMKQLVDLGLIEEERQGINKPNLIYLTKIDADLIGFEDDFGVESDMYPDYVCNREIAEKSIDNVDSKEYAVAEIKETVIEVDNNLPEGKIIDFQAEKNKIYSSLDRKNLSVQREQTEYFSLQSENKLLSGLKESFTPDRKNLSGSIINKALNNSSLNNLSNQSYFDGIDNKKKNRKYYENLVKSKIDYCIVRNASNIREIDLILEVMTDNLSTSNKFVNVIRENKPVEDVKERLMQLNQFHIEYVIECLQESNTEIRNIKSYVLTALYNAPATMDFYYDNKVKAMLG